MDTYNKLYNFQNLVLNEVGEMNTPFYLTGGTALGRFYLNHRWSDDLDFFVNAEDAFGTWVKQISQQLKKVFRHDAASDVVAEDFYRCFLENENLHLKVEFVNDVESYTGAPIIFGNFKLDNVENILSNKLSALIGRDEAKDVFDIIFISLNYSFNWKTIFTAAKEKALMNELDILQRLTTFPVELFTEVRWRKEQIDLNQYSEWLKQIALDFSLGNDNSLGKDKMNIKNAKPNLKN